MKKILRLLSLSVVTLIGITAFSVSTSAQNALEQECDKIYNEQFLILRRSEQSQAYLAAKEYLEKCSHLDRQGVDVIQKYLKAWIVKYEWGKLLSAFDTAFNNKDLPNIYKYGKEILTKTPEEMAKLEQLRLVKDSGISVRIKMGYAGYIAEQKKITAYRKDAITYAKQAIEIIESGKAPDSWQPFKDKEDTLAWLNFILGYITSSNGSATYFYKTLIYNSTLKTDLSAYYHLANYYSTQHQRVTNTINEKCLTGASVTNECKALIREQEAWYDLWFDVSAHIACLDKNQANGKSPTQMLKEIFKNDYNFMEESANEVIDCKSLPQKPLIDPATKLNVK